MNSAWTKQPSGHYTLHLTIILALTACLRLTSLFYVYSTHPEQILNPDSPTYENPALALMETGRFDSAVSTPNQPETMRTPGYPVFIAMVYKVMGRSHRSLMAIQVILSLTVIGVAFVIARLFWGPRIALLAALILALDPLSFIFSQLMLSETLFSVFFTLAAFFGVKAIIDSRHEGWWALLLGLLLALATLTRPVSQYVIYPVVILLVLAKRYQGRSWAGSFKIALLIAIPWVIGVGGWQARNYIQTGRSELSTIKSYNLLWYRGAGVVALRDHISLDEARVRIEHTLPDTKGWSSAKLAELYQREGLALLKAHPLLTLKTQIQGAMALLFGPSTRDLAFFGFDISGNPIEDLRRIPLKSYIHRWCFEQPLLLLLFVGKLLYILLCYAGAALALRSAFRFSGNYFFAHVLLWGLLAYIVLVSAGPEAYSRFRVPLVPILSIYAAYGLAAMFNALRLRYARTRQATS